jgi:hypothetical protein
MRTKELVIGDKKFVIRELKAREVDDIDFDNKKEAIKKQVMFSTGMSEDTYNELTFYERLKLMNDINELNGLLDIVDFQKPTKE